jgi:dihydroxyacetone kinase-like protein
MKCSSTEIILLFRDILHTIEANESYLNDLDSEIGDSEHGTNLKRCFQVLSLKLDNMSIFPPEKIIKQAGAIIMASGGGSGPTFIGIGIQAFGQELLENDSENIQQLSNAFQKGLEKIQAKGKASLGSKTLVDALLPFVKTFHSEVVNKGSLLISFEKALVEAKKGMLSTINLVAQCGRSSYLGERSKGHQDPGATSIYLILENIYRFLLQRETYHS